MIGLGSDKKTKTTTRTKHFSKEDDKGLNLPISQKILYVFDLFVISMTLSVVVLSLKVCPNMSFRPRVPLKQTSLGSRRSSILSEVKGRGCHFDDTPFLTSSLSSLTCTKLTVFA